MTTMSTYGKVFTISAAAQELGISRWTMYQLINAGLIRRTYITPKTPRITQSELDRYLDSVTV